MGEFDEVKSHSISTKRDRMGKGSLLLKYNNCIILNFFIFIFLISNGLMCNGYVMEETGLSQSYLHHRLAGRQRREVQRKFLDLLGLPHRPKARPKSLRKLRDNSGPLYMLGLYKTVSGFKNYEFNPQRTQRKRDSPFSHQFGEPDIETNSYPQDPDLWRVEPTWVRHNQALQVFSNEVGTLEYASSASYLSSTHLQGSLMMEDPNVMMSYDTVESNNVEKKLLGDADFVMSLMATKPDLDEPKRGVLRRKLKKHKSFYFDLSKLDDNNEMISSKFRIYKDVSEPNLSNETFRISVYQAFESNDEFDVVLLESRRVMGSQEGWLVFDITQSTKDWINNSNSNFGLHVTAESLNGRNKNLNKIGYVGYKRDGTKHSFMVTFFSQGATKLVHHLNRKRRSVTLNPEEEYEEDEYYEDEEMAEEDEEVLREYNDEDDFEEEEEEEMEIDEFDISERKRSRSKRNKKQRGSRGKKARGRKRNRNQREDEFDIRKDCQRKFLKVFFKDVGWEDWIIAPQAYEAYYCSGECNIPLSPNMNATNHAIIKTLLNFMEIGNVPTSCCSPTKLEEISVLYFDDKENVIFKRYKDMQVTACGCA